MKKTLPPAYRIVKSFGQGSFSRLAEYMWRSRSTISQTLRKERIHFNNRFDYMEAINWCFWSQYEMDDLFPTAK